MGYLALVRVRGWKENAAEDGDEGDQGLLDYDPFINWDLTFITRDTPQDSLVLTSSRRTKYRGPYASETQPTHDWWISREASFELAKREVV